MEDERELIYFAISNLIKDCLESLDGMQKLPPDAYSKEEREMLEYICFRAQQLEEKYRCEIEKEALSIQRPNWADLDSPR